MLHWHLGRVPRALFYVYIARARLCFNCFKELTHERLVKACPFQSITRPSTSASWVDDSGQYPTQMLQ